MLISFWLTAALAVAAPPEAVEWPTIRIDPGRELVWMGSAEEITIRNGSTLKRDFRLEVRLLGLHASEGIHTVAIQTIWKPIDELADAKGGRVVSLELAELLADGKLRRLAVGTDGKTQRSSFPPPPPDRLPGTETALFLEAPAELPAVGSSWKRTATDGPEWTRSLEDSESIRTGRVLRITGSRTQSTGNDRWECTETVWISALKGHMVQLEREMSMRSVAQADGEYKLKTRLEMVREVQLGAKSETFRERRVEIEQVLLLRAAYEAVASDRGNRSPRRFDAVLARMERYRDASAATHSLPWRDSLDGLIRRTETAARGIASVDVVAFASVASAVHPLAEGANLPEFRAKDVAGRFEIHTPKFRGHAIVLVWYRPDRPETPGLLARLQTLKTGLPKGTEVFGLASGSEIAAWRQGAELELGFPILGGGETHDRFRVGKEPLLVLIDTDGVIRESLAPTVENLEKVRGRIRELSR